MSPRDLRRISTVRTLVANGEARARREDLRLTLREVADAIGASPSTVQRWEQQRSSPRAIYALRWAAALEINAEAA